MEQLNIAKEKLEALQQIMTDNFMQNLEIASAILYLAIETGYAAQETEEQIMSFKEIVRKKLNEIKNEIEEDFKIKKQGD